MSEYVPTETERLLSVGALVELLQRPDWHRDAACREYPDLSWFPERGQQVDELKAICDGCLVRRECLDAALDFGSLCLGIWGGTSARQRRPLLAVHGRGEAA